MVSKPQLIMITLLSTHHTDLGYSNEWRVIEALRDEIIMQLN